MILSIDPGTTKSAYVLLDYDEQLVDFGILENCRLVEQLKLVDTAELAIEMLACFGKVVGVDMLVTARWIGRFQQAYHSPDRVQFLYRKQVVMNLCGIANVGDPRVRQALIDRYGGNAATKKGGALYKVATHVWAALAVGCTYADLKKVGRL